MSYEHASCRIPVSEPRASCFDYHAANIQPQIVDSNPGAAFGVGGSRVGSDSAPARSGAALPCLDFADGPPAVDLYRVWAVLPKPSHNSVAMVGVMRLLIALMLLASTSSAPAQYPWVYPQYRSIYPPYGGPYIPPAQRRSPASLSQAMLAAHNAVRSRVGVPPLAWSDQLVQVAQDWANHLIATGSFSHRPDNSYGENLYSISGGTVSPAQVISYWAGEARGYDLRSNTCAGVCGHYTQIVWEKTRAVGCAVAADGRREVWVCNYDPAGNVVGYRPY
jgi:pathogenesis-related protein 1